MVIKIQPYIEAAGVGPFRFVLNKQLRQRGGKNERVMEENRVNEVEKESLGDNKKAREKDRDTDRQTDRQRQTQRQIQGQTE